MFFTGSEAALGLSFEPPRSEKTEAQSTRRQLGAAPPSPACSCPRLFSAYVRLTRHCKPTRPPKTSSPRPSSKPTPNPPERSTLSFCDRKLAEHAHQCHAQPVRALEGAPVGGDAEASVAGEVRVLHRNRHSHAGLIFVVMCRKVEPLSLARLPLASVVTSWVGPDCAVLLAPEVMPAW